MVEINRVLSTQFNVLNHELHAVAGRLRPDDWLRRGAPGTNLPAFTLWHIARIADSTVNMGIRGQAEVIESEPWSGKAWARLGTGVGYSLEEADALAALVVPDELVAYCDAVRAQVSGWLKTQTEADLEAPNQLMKHAIAREAYNSQANREAGTPLVGMPVWLVLSVTSFAHLWGHLEEIDLLARAGRPGA